MQGCASWAKLCQVLLTIVVLSWHAQVPIRLTCGRQAGAAHGACGHADMRSEGTGQTDVQQASGARLTTCRLRFPLMCYLITCIVAQKAAKRFGTRAVRR